MNEPRKTYINGIYDLNNKIPMKDIMLHIGAVKDIDKSTKRIEVYKYNEKKYIIYSGNPYLIFEQIDYKEKPKTLNLFSFLKDNNLIKDSFEFHKYVKDFDINLIDINQPINNTNIIQDISNNKFDLSKYRIITNPKYDYFINARGININILKSNIFENLIFQGNKKMFRFNNIILKLRQNHNDTDFKHLIMYYDSQINGKNKIMAEGARNGAMFISNKNSSNIQNLYLYESAIDMFSYIELKKPDINNSLFIATLGNIDKEQIKNIHKIVNDEQIKTLYTCFDNDLAGKKLSNTIIKEFENINVCEEYPTAKDFNEDLMKIKC